MSVSTVATCIKPLQRFAILATMCNKSRKDCIRTNWVRSFQWKWSQVCLNNHFNADCSCNICNNCKNMQQNRKNTLSGQIERTLSNGDGLRFVWRAVSRLTAAATSRKKFLFFVFWIEFLWVADRSRLGFRCWNPLVTYCLEFIGGCNKCNGLQ